MLSKVCCSCYWAELVSIVEQRQTGVGSEGFVVAARGREKSVAPDRGAPAEVQRTWASLSAILKVVLVRCG